MVEGKLSIQVTLKEVYDVLCPQCRKKLKELIKEKITDEMVRNVLGEQIS